MNLVRLYYKMPFKPKMETGWFITELFNKGAGKPEARAQLALTSTRKRRTEEENSERGGKKGREGRTPWRW